MFCFSRFGDQEWFQKKNFEDKLSEVIVEFLSCHTYLIGFKEAKDTISPSKMVASILCCDVGTNHRNAGFGAIWL